MGRKYPRAYAESTLLRMRERLCMPPKDIELLEDYFVAIGNFYEILSLSDAYKVISTLDKGLVTEQKFYDFAEMKRHTPSLDYRILGKESFFSGAQESEVAQREIIHVSVIDVDEYFYHELKGRQYGIPLYIPPKNQLLCYVSEEYYEKNGFTEALRYFLISELFMDERESTEYILDAYMHIRVCDEPEGAFSLWTEFLENGIEGRGIKQLSEEQYEKLAMLFYDMYDNTRLPCYRGYTLNERLGAEESCKPVNEGHEEIFGYDYLPTAENTGQIAGFPYSGSFTDFTGDYVDSRVTKKKI